MATEMYTMQQLTHKNGNCAVMVTALSPRMAQSEHTDAVQITTPHRKFVPFPFRLLPMLVLSMFIQPPMEREVK